MKLHYLGLILTLGTATAVCPSGSAAQESKKRKTPEPEAKNSENESPKAKKARTSASPEPEAKAASANASTTAATQQDPVIIDDKPDKREKTIAADSSASASASAATAQKTIPMSLQFFLDQAEQTNLNPEKFAIDFDELMAILKRDQDRSKQDILTMRGGAYIRPRFSML